MQNWLSVLAVFINVPYVLAKVTKKKKTKKKEKFYLFVLTVPSKTGAFNQAQNFKAYFELIPTGAFIEDLRTVVTQVGERTVNIEEIITPAGGGTVEAEIKAPTVISISLHLSF